MLLFIECVSADDLRYENDITLEEIYNTLRGVTKNLTTENTESTEFF